MSLFTQKITEKFAHQQQLDRELAQALLMPKPSNFFMQTLTKELYLQNAVINKIIDDLQQKTPVSPQALSMLQHIAENAPNNHELQCFQRLLSKERQSRKKTTEWIHTLFGYHSTDVSPQNQQAEALAAIQSSDTEILDSLLQVTKTKF